MKKRFFALLTGFILGYSAMLQAQGNTDASSTSNQKNREKIIAPATLPEVAYPGLPLNNINAEAARHLARTYKEVPDAKWYKTETGFVTYFTTDDVKTRIFYDNRGCYLNKICFYYENKLPGDIRHLIRSNFYDYSIYFITEVHANNKVAFLVKVENETEWKTIKVVEGEFEVIETIEKT